MKKAFEMTLGEIVCLSHITGNFDNMQRAIDLEAITDGILAVVANTKIILAKEPIRPDSEQTIVNNINASFQGKIHEIF